MNKSYKSVWNDAAGTWVAAQENAKGQGKKNRSIKTVASAAVGMAMAIGTSAAHAGAIVNCDGAATGNYGSYTFGTDGAWSTVANAPSCTGGYGVILNENSASSSQQTGYARLVVGGTSSTNSGTITLYGPSGIALNGATTTSGLATFKAGADMSDTTITNVAAGAVSSTSTDAVNGSQLFATNQNVDALNASVGLLKQDATSHAITMASATAGTTVDFTGTEGARQLKGVAAGTDDTDAVNIQQLKALGLSTDTNGNVSNAFVAYDDATKGKITLAAATSARR
jgi:autotransporter adhesin